jgi:hypothetical protein
MAGYSGTPLPRKLGLGPGSRFGVYAAPQGFGAALGALPQGVTLTDATRGKTALDVILCFADSRRALEQLLPRAQRRLDPNGGLWICWPKKASGIATDVTEADVRRLGLEAGLVDNKVCAIDATWSGLRMVVRLADRPPLTRARKTSGKAAVPSARHPKKF